MKILAKSGLYTCLVDFRACTRNVSNFSVNGFWGNGSLKTAARTYAARVLANAGATEAAV